MVVSLAKGVRSQFGSKSSVQVYYNGLGIHSCRVPVLRIVTKNVLSPILTDCIALVRKSIIPLSKGASCPRSKSSVGIMMLKAEL